MQAQDTPRDGGRQIREVIAEARRFCVCEHPVDQHGDSGRGSCEHSAECGCKRFIAVALTEDEVRSGLEVDDGDESEEPSGRFPR